MSAVPPAGHIGYVPIELITTNQASEISFATAKFDASKRVPNQSDHVLQKDQNYFLLVKGWYMIEDKGRDGHDVALKTVSDMPCPNPSYSGGLVRGTVTPSRFNHC